MKELCDRYWDQDPKKNPHTLQNVRFILSPRISYNCR